MLRIRHHARKDEVGHLHVWRSPDCAYEFREAIRDYHLVNDSLELRNDLGWKVVPTATTRTLKPKEHRENLYYWQAMQAGTARVFALVHTRFRFAVASVVLDLSGEQPLFCPIWSDRKQQVTPVADFYTPLQQALRAVERQVGRHIPRDPFFGSRMVGGRTLTPDDRGWHALAELKAVCCRLQHELDLGDGVILCEAMERYVSHRSADMVRWWLSHGDLEQIESVQLPSAAREELIAALEVLSDAMPDC